MALASSILKKYLPKQQAENTTHLHLHFSMGKGYLKDSLYLGTSRKGVSLSRIYKSLMFIFVIFFVSEVMYLKVLLKSSGFLFAVF